MDTYEFQQVSFQEFLQEFLMKIIYNMSSGILQQFPPEIPLGMLPVPSPKMYLAILPYLEFFIDYFGKSYRDFF